MTRKIPLSGKHGKGLFALVDNEDYGALVEYSWTVQLGGPRKDLLYAISQCTVDGQRQYLAMHRSITGAPKGTHVDHISGDTLDNRKENLRICTLAQNLRNSRNRSDSGSRFKGVGWAKDCGKWRARIKVDGKEIYLGLHSSELEAARAYDIAALKYFREFGRLNFPAGLIPGYSISTQELRFL